MIKGGARHLVKSGGRVISWTPTSVVAGKVHPLRVAFAEFELQFPLPKMQASGVIVSFIKAWQDRKPSRAIIF